MSVSQLPHYPTRPSDNNYTQSDFEMFVYTELNLEHLYNLIYCISSGPVIWHRELNLQNDDTLALAQLGL
jgi:hypothetical protein